MNGFAVSVANGFCMGVGLIVAALVMKLLFHVGWCG